MGWVQIANFIVTSLLIIAGAAGLWRILRGERGGTWGPVLLGLYGLGLVGAGIFKADPMNGFPPGTPEGPPAQPTINGLLHILTGAVGFLGLIAASFVLARHFFARGERGWAAFSIITGVLFLIGFFGLAGGSQLAGVALQIVTLAFTASLILAWTWISSVMAHFLRGGDRA